MSAAAKIKSSQMTTPMVNAYESKTGIKIRSHAELTSVIKKTVEHLAECKLCEARVAVMSGIDSKIISAVVGHIMWPSFRNPPTKGDLDDVGSYCSCVIL